MHAHCRFLLDGGFVYFDRPDAALQSKTCFEKLETMVGITVMESATTVSPPPAPVKPVPF